MGGKLPGTPWMSNQNVSAHLIVAATEAEALWDHGMDLSLPVLLANALVGRQPRQSLIQVVVIWLSYYKQPSRKLDYTHTHQKEVW